MVSSWRGRRVEGGWSRVDLRELSPGTCGAERSQRASQSRLERWRLREPAPPSSKRRGSEGLARGLCESVAWCLSRVASFGCLHLTEPSELHAISLLG